MSVFSNKFKNLNPIRPVENYPLSNGKNVVKSDHIPMCESFSRIMFLVVCAVDVPLYNHTHTHHH